jgi:hypothetical protein
MTKILEKIDVLWEKSPNLVLDSNHNLCKKDSCESPNFVSGRLYSFPDYIYEIDSMLGGYFSMSNLRQTQRKDF